jgi:arsenite oxidase small subunit
MVDKKLTDEFPIDWEDDDYVTRREFFRFMTLASGGLALGSGVIAGFAALSREGRAMERQLVAKASELAVGQSMNFNYPRSTDLCILIHRREGEFVAYSRRCTHLSCPVNYEHDKNRLYCPCHNGVFDVGDGSVKQGPPPRPLPKIMLERDGDDLYAVGVTRGSEA